MRALFALLLIGIATLVGAETITNSVPTATVATGNPVSCATSGGVLWNNAGVLGCGTLVWTEGAVGIISKTNNLIALKATAFNIINNVGQSVFAMVPNTNQGSLNGQFYVSDSTGADFASPSVMGFGGNSASFPGLARNGARLEVKLGDNSNYANLGNAGGISLGTQPALSGTCAAGTQTGGMTAGTLTTTGACAGTTIILTFGQAAPTGWACDFNDRTAVPGTAPRQTASATNSATMLITTAGAEVFSFKCLGY